MAKAPCTLDENTRALLTRAAAAVGITIQEWVGDQANVIMPDGGCYGWNPLARWGRGEAFTLAVDKCLYVRYHQALGQGIASNIQGDEWWVNVEDCRRDPHAATQRAIVLAVAGEKPNRTRGVKEDGRG